MYDIRQQAHEAINLLVKAGAEQGLRVAAYRNGEQVVGAVVGTADPATGRPRVARPKRVVRSPTSRRKPHLRPVIGNGFGRR
jgi:hypothetical protein